MCVYVYVCIAYYHNLLRLLDFKSANLIMWYDKKQA